MSKTIDKYMVKHTAAGETGEVVHYDGGFQPGDVALCGHDLMGDSLGWEQGVITDKKVNCPACLRTVKQVKLILEQRIK